MGNTKKATCVLFMILFVVILIRGELAEGNLTSSKLLSSENNSTFSEKEDSEYIYQLESNEIKQNNLIPSKHEIFGAVTNIKDRSDLVNREFVRELKSLVSSQQSDDKEGGIDIRNTLRSMLNSWAQLTVISAASGIIMLFCNFSLSLFFTISDVSLSLFWLLHSVLFLSQITLVISITVGATLTLSNVNRRNICHRYFVIPFPTNVTNESSFVQHGNLIYQRVSINNIPNGDIQPPNNVITDHTESIKNNVIVGNYLERPKINVRRSATFNCAPRAVYTHSHQPYTNPVPSNHLLCAYPIDERVAVDNHNCALQFRNKNYSRKNDTKPYYKISSDRDEYPFSPSKFPIMGCNGRSRYGSLHSLPNISPRIRSPPTNPQYYNVNEAESFIRSIPENPAETSAFPIGNQGPETVIDDSQTGICVKEIIMENQNLFRSHSLRQNRNRERVSIRTIPPQNYSMIKPSYSLVHRNQIKDLEKSTIILDDKFIQLEKYENSRGASIYSKTINDSQFSQYPTIEKSKLHCQENYSEVNSIDKIDLHISEQHSVRKDLKIPSDNLKCWYHDIITDLEKPIFTELNSSKYDISHNNGKGQVKSKPVYSEKSKESIDKLDTLKDLAVNNDNIEINPKTNDVQSEQFSAFTLPLLKRKNSTDIKTQNLSNGKVIPDAVVHKNVNYGNNWYGTWAGRKSKRRNLPNNDESSFQQNLRKLSASKTSLSNLYDKLKHKKYKTSMTSIHTLDAEESDFNIEAIENELVIVEVKDGYEDEETLPKISEDLDLASEILKSSSMLADFLVNKDSHETQESNFKSLESSVLEMKT